MRLKRMIAALSAAVLLLGSAAGCGQKTENKEVRLKYIMAGDPDLDDNAKVWEAFNARLQEKLPGVTVDFELIPLAEYRQKFMLMSSAREQMDIVNNYRLDLFNEIKNGTFEPMNALLDEYGGQLKAALPEFMWDYQKYDGEIYGVPTYQMCGDFRGIFFFKEQAEKYLDIEGFKKALYKSPTFTQEVYDMLTKYIEDMKADGLNFKSATVLNEKGYEPIISGLGYIVKGDESCQIINKDMSDAARIRFKTAREWYEKGYIREDVLSATDDNNYMGKIDGFPFWDGVWTPFVAEQYSQKYGHELIVIPYEDEYYIPSKNSAAGTSIMSTSKYKKEAMQVLNLIQTDKELYNMLVFGLEGEHYKKTGDDSVEVLDDNGTASNSKYALAKWLLGNTELAYNNQFEPDAYKTWVFEEANRSEWKSPLLGFMPDTTDIQDYMTQLNVVTETYKKPLTVGVMSNWEEYLREYEAELNKVGNKEMLANVQNQIDEFLANKA